MSARLVRRHRLSVLTGKKREYFSSYMAKFVLLDVQKHIHSGPAALTTTGDANICSSQRLEFIEGFRSSFVFGGAPVSSSPWVPFRALR